MTLEQGDSSCNLCTHIWCARIHLHYLHPSAHPRLCVHRRTDILYTSGFICAHLRCADLHSFAHKHACTRACMQSCVHLRACMHACSCFLVHMPAWTCACTSVGVLVHTPANADSLHVEWLQQIAAAVFVCAAKANKIKTERYLGRGFGSCRSAFMGIFPYSASNK